MTAVSCPECGHEFAVTPKALFADHTMTVKFEMQPGSMMQLGELGKSLAALAKLGELSSKQAGAKRPVLLIKSLKTEGDSIAVEFLMMDQKSNV